jgi:hypothetical protein
MKLTRKEVADRAEKLLGAYLSSRKRHPNRLSAWYAAAVWLVQELNPCEDPYTQMELAKIYNTNQGNVSTNTDRIMARLPEARQIARGL